MTHPSIGLLDRYQEYRVRRWQEREQKTAGMLPGWRTRTRRRRLVIVVAAAIITMFVIGLLCVFDLRWLPLALIPVALAFIPAWGILRITLDSHDNAPDQALDEMEIEQRNTARSMGLGVTQGLTIIPVFYLILVGAFFPDTDAFRTAYSGGVMALATLLAGGCTPGMILAWTRPDPDPEP
ncbi:hypothetical protein GZH49_03640 [Nocardia terpenica]|uniref:hypothetical protein n=1 Tax=Nocardia terpenica TaxID=455432 RepID=UPI002FE21C9D